MIMQVAEFADCVSHATCKNNKLDVNTNRKLRVMNGEESTCFYRQVNVYVHEHAFIYKIYMYTNISLSGKIQNTVEVY